MRRILHVDLDAFYASVEELDHPEYAGHPLIVGADPQEGKGRGVVTTANYAARAFGVRSAMPISEAYRRCPQARFVFPRFDRYHDKSEEVFAILRGMADAIEQSGIDEGYLDVSERTGSFEEALALGGEIQRVVKERTGLSISVGVAASKLVAKIATDMRKPFGLTGVPPGTEEAFLAPLPARKIPGVGPKTDARLEELGIRTCSDLAAAPQRLLVQEFGSFGPRLAEMASGVDETPVETGWERKSLGSETTFMEDQADPVVWEATLRELATGAVEDLRREGKLARTLTIKVRVTGFETHTRARTIPRPSDDPETFAGLAVDLLRADPPTRAVRLLGVRLTHLSTRSGPVQQDLRSWPADVLGEAEPWRGAQRRLDELG